MGLDPNTIGGQIECLARLTGAPDSFVRQVRSLFRNKGISLQAEAAPYLRALEDAFRREHTIRSNAGRTRAELGKLQQQFKDLGSAYREQLDRLKTIRNSLKTTAERIGAPTEGADKRRKKRVKLAVSTRGKTIVTRLQRDGRSMVPGPKDVQ